MTDSLVAHHQITDDGIRLLSQEALWPLMKSVTYMFSTSWFCVCVCFYFIKVLFYSLTTSCSLIYQRCSRSFWTQWRILKLKGSSSPSCSTCYWCAVTTWLGTTSNPSHCSDFRGMSQKRMGCWERWHFLFWTLKVFVIHVMWKVLWLNILYTQVQSISQTSLKAKFNSIKAMGLSLWIHSTSQ